MVDRRDPAEVGVERRRDRRRRTLRPRLTIPASAARRRAFPGRVRRSRRGRRRAANNFAVASPIPDVPPTMTMRGRISLMAVLPPTRSGQTDAAGLALGVQRPFHENTDGERACHGDRLLGDPCVEARLQIGMQPDADGMPYARFRRSRFFSRFIRLPHHATLDAPSEMCNRRLQCYQRQPARVYTHPFDRTGHVRQAGASRPRPPARCCRRRRDRARVSGRSRPRNSASKGDRRREETNHGLGADDARLLKRAEIRGAPPGPAAVGVVPTVSRRPRLDSPAGSAPDRRGSPASLEIVAERLVGALRAVGRRRHEETPIGGAWPPSRREVAP